MIRLTRIEALRFGHLKDACAGDLGEGLTVVLGPNESGKSTLAALVRHVLYGFPDKRTKDRSYSPAAGERHGRLVFSDGDGEWAVERIEGRKGGTCSVRTIRGNERSHLLDDLTADVSESTFRVVFGFGLDELAAIEHPSSDDVIGRLYAAGAGLPVSPVDVRRSFDQSAAAIYAPSASKPLVNSLVREVRQTQSAIRELEGRAAEYADDQARAAQLRDTLAEARGRRDSVDLRMRSLSRDVDRFTDRTRELEDLMRQRSDESENLDQLRGRLATLGDPATELRLVDALPGIEALLEDAGAFRQRLTTMQEREDAARSAITRAASEFSGIPEDVDTSIEAATAIDRWRDRLSRLELASETAARGSEREQAALGAARAQTGPAAAETARALRTPPLVAWLIVTIGVLSFSLGLAFAQPISAMLGSAVALLGIALVVWRPLASRSAAPDADRTADELRRLERNAFTAAEGETRANEELARARSEWATWLVEHHLDSEGSDPSAVRQLLERAHARQRALADARERQEEADREREAASEWASRLTAAAAPFATVPDSLELLAIPAFIERTRAAVTSVRDSASERRKLASSAAELEGRLKGLAVREATAHADLDAIAANNDVADVPDSIAALQMRLSHLATEHAGAIDAYDNTAKELHELEGRLDAAGRDERMSAERLSLESLRERLRVAAERYLVLSYASRLMTRAQERYERDRQPEVVRTAGRIFGNMTGGRYASVRVPLGGGGIEAIDERGASWTTDRMSRGAAEQLYLALRISLIEQLEERGAGLPVLMDDILVDFDPERRDSAASAIGELAGHRQVVVFTCHPQTAEVLERMVPGTSTIRLDRCEL